MQRFCTVALICCLFIICCLGQQNKNVEVKNPVQSICLGCETPQDPNDPLYREMAEEALKINLRLNSIHQPHHVVQVNSVTLQIVTGYITRINFTAAPNCIALEDPDCEVNLPVDLSCSSKTLEKPWIGHTEIEVPCEKIRE
ncbi:unnamed protein product [Euphydryas editha]|uniref:Uncharacterized protein n=1 Tax=Euphydryas editha TaxID=104508 RepID=A0AAU9U830_EUPED|nr:unnamed protein product [Euphydryas editha]